MDNEDVVCVYISVCILRYTHTKYTHTHTQCNTTQPLKKKKNKQWNNAVCGHMDGHRDYHTKWSKPDKYCMISFKYGLPW